jgi:dsDNA-specific endonuclease/ATPase MutS2
MNVFKEGDRVAVLDDNLTGTVLRIAENTVTIATDEGFELTFTPSELIHIQKDEHFKVTNFDVAQIKSEKEATKKKHRPLVKSKERNIPKMEVDLHIHHLVPSTRGMSNFDMLNVQIATAKRQLEFAMSKRIQKVVFIHGVGAGVLKEELFYLFKRYPNISHYDADFQKYGLGATEIYIHQNTNETL